MTTMTAKMIVARTHKRVCHHRLSLPIYACLVLLAVLVLATVYGL
jgi:hypothetical protein